jgi:hypothetical protein
MESFESINEFLVQSKTQIPILGFVFNLILTGLHALAIKWVYIRYGSTLSNRTAFGKNFLLIALTTMLIITIVKSSLALSLGLVGALSIIRFRSAIKEPEELAYLFLAISIGLGFGANQGVVTTIGVIMILTMIMLGKKYYNDKNDQNNLHVSILSKTPKAVNLDSLISMLSNNCSRVDLRRLDETKESIELLFVIEYENYQQLIIIKNALFAFDNNIKITYLDNNIIT